MDAIVFDDVKLVTIVQEQKVEVSSIDEYEYRDMPAQRIVQVKFIKPALGIMTLWQDEDYDLIGDWTEEQAIARIKELIK